MDRLAELNPAQRDAVLTLSGPLLVLAGAGTGKTRVITHRMVELIRNGTAPDRILSVTFTNKAAREMQARATALIGRRMKQRPVISTFHSLCVRILREEIQHLGYPQKFTIYDRGDQESAARTALRDIRVGDKAMKPGDLINCISRWKSAGILPAEATEHVDTDLDFLAATAYRRYQANLRAAGAVDFDDLLLLTNQLFADFPEVLARHQQRFEQVQIDEYQDTNGAQFRLVEALVRPHRNICVVGDDDQSIYGWRGAEVEHILNFSGHFPGAHVVRLQDNYRCTDKILELANRLVRHNRQRHEKTLVPHRKSGENVIIRAYPDEQTEAEGVVREIDYLVNGCNVPAGHIAILFRTNEQPRVFEQELRRAKLRYVLVGGQSFFDRREIRDLMAYLKTIDNPNDEASLRRILNVPARGISAAAATKIAERAVTSGRSFWETARHAGQEKAISSKAAAAISSFEELLRKYRARFSESPRKLGELIQALLDEIDYESEIAKQYKEPHQQLARTAMLEQLVDSAASYVEKNRNPTLTGFLDDAALLDRHDENDQDDRLGENAVKLMTLHSAKGLEFPRVYLVGLEEGILPHRRSIEDSENAIAEERRLAYVGITRARDVLTISRACGRMKWGKRRKTLPSRFLFEMHTATQTEEILEQEAEVEAEAEEAMEK